MQRGFSLVELSIVLVILGLLTGGILAGQSLIRAAELRAVSSEFQRYHTAVRTFQDKYFANPGDFPAATRFWGLQTNSGTCISNSGITTPSLPGACDGNGDNQIAVGPEGFQFWRQLALAGLIEGSYTGLTGGAAPFHSILGTNVPTSRVANAGWGVPTTGSVGVITNAADFFNGNYTNPLLFGAISASVAPLTPRLPVLKPEEAWNIDTKMDDGKPATGSLLVRDRANGCTVSSGGADLTTATADAAALDANYKLVNDSIACALIFRNFY